jgi:pyruvate-ferredoxin/flavodoxin oxidoreductase
MAMTYGNVYVASVAMGARNEHTLKAFLEAEAYEGPSLILAYSHCIAHGINMAKGMDQQQLAVESGRWLLYRYDPRKAEQGENPLMLDSRSPKRSLEEAMYSENRFKMLLRSNPEAAKTLLKQAREDVSTRWHMYQYLAARNPAEEPEMPTRQGYRARQETKPAQPGAPTNGNGGGTPPSSETGSNPATTST